MSNNDKLKNTIHSYFEESPTKDDYSYKATFKSTVDYLTTKFMDVLVHYFNNYSEEMFHQRMNNSYILIDGRTKQHHKLTGFDFVGDFKKYHKIKFLGFVFLFNKSKNVFGFNEERILRTLLELFRTKGWQLRPGELEGIRSTVKRLYNILYNKYDGL